MIAVDHRLCAVLLVALAAATAAPGARAAVYKCTVDGGSVIYQESPCPAGKELRNFETDPPDLSVIPPRLQPAPPRPPAAAAADRPPRDSRPLDGDKSIGKVNGDAAARKFIRQGMNEAEVLARIGRPDATAGGGKQHQVRWSYLPDAADPDTVTTITFTSGAVSEVSRKVIKK